MSLALQQLIDAFALRADPWGAIAGGCAVGCFVRASDCKWLCKRSRAHEAQASRLQSLLEISREIISAKT